MFLYFIPSDRPVFAPSEIDSAGLRYAIESGTRTQPLRAGASPSGQAGFIVADSASVASCKYHPDQQTWVRRFDSVADRSAVGTGHDRPAERSTTEVWIGYPKDTPPPLASLARSKQLPGSAVALSDGTQLIIPIARRWAEHDGRLLWSTVLPQSLRRDDEGKWVPRAVTARYRRLWEMLTGYIDAAEAAMQTADVAPGSSVFFAYEAINDLAIAAITANYRAAADEVEICGVYDVETRDAIISVLKDDATREAWIKKKVQALIVDGGNTSSGLTPSTPAETPDTAPPSPTSTHTDGDCIASE